MSCDNQYVICASCNDQLEPEHKFPVCKQCIDKHIQRLCRESILEIRHRLSVYKPSEMGGYVGPEKDMLIRIEANEAIRIVLGDECNGPDIRIERQQHGWQIALHPNEHDPLGIVHMNDDGGVTFVRETVSGKESIALKR